MNPRALARLRAIWSKLKSNGRFMRSEVRDTWRGATPKEKGQLALGAAGGIGAASLVGGRLETRRRDRKAFKKFSAAVATGQTKGVERRLKPGQTGIAARKTILGNQRPIGGLTKINKKKSIPWRFERSHRRAVGYPYNRELWS